jgi:4-amino-4-deoxy-L-arabinose transferase-like glycosyltransferase
MSARKPYIRKVYDTEFEALPVEERRDATELKVWYGIRNERAVRYRKLQNIIGATAITVVAGLGVARLTNFYELPAEVDIPMAIAGGVAIGLAGNYGRRSREERGLAERNAEIISGMFVRAEQEPPTWTQSPSLGE